MIHYMPFTYIPDALFSTLAASLSPFTVCQPLRARVPAHMAEAAARNLIKLHCLSAVDQNALQQTLKELDAWAALHQRRPADLAAFFFDRAGSHAPLDEQTHQIRSTILQSGRAGQPPSALWQAALFLCLAHRYDEQQEMLQRTMRSVTALERQLDLFIGERGQEEGPPEPYLPASGRTATEDAGLYMTEQRVTAWAHLAGAAKPGDLCYITTSRAIWDYLRERLPQTAPLLVARPVAGGEQLASAIAALAQAVDPAAFRLELPARADRETLLTLHVLRGCTPFEMLDRLRPAPLGPARPQAGAHRPLNTLLGYLQTRGV